MVDLTNYGPGRPPLPETMEIMKAMVDYIREEPGIRSAKLARKVGLTSLQCSTIAKRMAKQGHIEIGKDQRALTYRIKDND